MLGTRELAAITWGVVLLAILLWKPEGRRGLAQAAKTAAQPVILLPFILFLAWMGLGVFIGFLLGAWQYEFLAVTIFWALTSGVASLFKLDAAAKDPRFLVHQVREILALTIIIDFFVNVESFGYFLELALQGVLGLLVMTAVYAEYNTEYRKAGRLVNGLVAIFMLVLLGGGIASVIRQQPTATDWLEFAIPLWLGLWALPYVLSLGSYSNFDRVFRMMSLTSRSKRIRARNVLPLMRIAMRPRKFSQFRNYWERELAEAKSIMAANGVVSRFLAIKRDEDSAVKAEAEALVANTGKKGVDEDGRQLDRREFKETWKALEHIDMWHFGWYDKEPVGYKAEKVAGFIENQEWKGLPPNHGIHMTVSADGRAWMAWRLTPSGWVIAVGNREHGRFAWRFDGPQPPTGFPTPGEEWGTTVFEQMSSPNQF